MKTKLLLGAMLAIAAFSTTAQDRYRTTFGGVMDCGRWLTDRSNNSAEAETWLLGYLTGLNFEDPKGNWLGKITSSQQIFFWMDKYCKENPLGNVISGSLELRQELIEK